MSKHRALNLFLTAIITAVASTAYLLDGPSELDAMQATADSKQDAIKLAATNARTTSARGQKDNQAIVAKAVP